MRPSQVHTMIPSLLGEKMLPTAVVVFLYIHSTFESK
jgi:hypothetical protein